MVFGKLLLPMCLALATSSHLESEWLSALPKYLGRQNGNEDPFPAFLERSGPRVQTSDGPVVGFKGEGVNQFLGIPFAAPPVGALRWRSPQHPEPWTSDYKAFKRGSICPQLNLLPSDGIVMLGNEDCLRLDVYVPENCNASSPCAVMQWIYGGAWILGDKFEFGDYPGSSFAKEHGVVVVAANYRLDSLGWLALGDLAEEDARGASGNYGLQDQTAALTWTNREIARFGGDPNRVTVFGESAGGFSVCQHLVSPDSNGLFSAAIIESGDCDGPWLLRAGKYAKQAGLVFSEAVGCTKDRVVSKFNGKLLTCLRSLKPHELVLPYSSWVTFGDWPFRNQTERISWLPDVKDWRDVMPPFAPLIAWTATVDGVVLPDNPLFLIRQGKINTSPTGEKIKVIMGTNHDEGMLFVGVVPLTIKPLSIPIKFSDMPEVANYVVDHHSFWNASTAQSILAAYPSSRYSSGGAMVAAALTHFCFTCGTRSSMKALAMAGNEVYGYHFNYHFQHWIDPTEKRCPALAMLGCGVYHSSELGFVWGKREHRIFSPAEDRAVSSTMSRYWTNMAISGNPNGDGEGLQLWEPYDPSKDNYLLIAEDGEFLPTIEVFKEECDFWTSLPEVGHYDPS